VLHALRSEPATAGVRCVVLSANAMPDRPRGRAGGRCHDYWTKPIDFTRFLADVGRCIGRAI
jgi:CheY-like chemotaxis protein